MQRVLLTGGCGHLGTALAQLLTSRGDVALRLDVASPRDCPVAGEHVLGDITRLEQVRAVMSRADAVVHIAAYHGIHEARGQRNRDEFFELNLRGTFNVLEAAVDAGVSQILFVSSTSVRDRSSLYGASKRMGEDLLRTYCAKHRLSAAIVRPRAFIPYWDADAYPGGFLEWARRFVHGGVHLDDVVAGVALAMDLVHAGHASHAGPEAAAEAAKLVMPGGEPPIFLLDGRNHAAPEEAEAWDQDGEAGSSFCRLYGGEALELATRHGLDVGHPWRAMQSESTVTLLGYSPAYSVCSMLQDLREWGDKGPAMPAYLRWNPSEATSAPIPPPKEVEPPSESAQKVAKVEKQSATSETIVVAPLESSLLSACGQNARIPYLDFAPQFVDDIMGGKKCATARCPGGPKDTDVTSDFAAVRAQGWALATCSSSGAGGFALLKIDRMEARALRAVDDHLARIEGMSTGQELRAALRYFYPLLEDHDVITIVHFHVLHAINNDKV